MPSCCGWDGGIELFTKLVMSLLDSAVRCDAKAGPGTRGVVVSMKHTYRDCKAALDFSVQTTRSAR
jgi:hypothetical protein